MFRLLNREETDLHQTVIRSYFWVGSWTAANCILMLVRSIVLARLLMPEIFGLISIATIVLSGIEVFTQTGFGPALIHRQGNFADAKDTTFTLIVIRGFLLAILTFFIAPLIAVYYQEPILKTIIRTITVCFILRGFKNINIVALDKEMNFKKRASFELISYPATVVAAIVLVYFMRNVWALVIAEITSALIPTILSYIMVPWKLSFHFNGKIARELLTYGKFITGGAAVAFIIAQGDNALVAKVLGLKILGYYVLAYNLATMIINHVNSLVTNVMFPLFSQLQEDLVAVQNEYLKTLKLVAIISFPLAAGIAMLAPEIIRIVYGEQWLPAVGALQVLCIFSAFLAIGGTAYPILAGMGYPNIHFYINSARLLLMALLIYPLTKSYGIIGTSYAVLIPLGLTQIFFFAFIIRKLQFKIGNLLTRIALPIGGSLVMVAFLVLCKSYIVIASIPILFMVVMVSALLYGLCHFLIEGRRLAYQISK